MAATSSPAIGKVLNEIKKGDPPANGAAIVKANQEFLNLRSFLDKAKGQLQLAAAEAISPDKLVRLALTAASKNPKLFTCRFETVGLSLLTVGHLKAERVPLAWLPAAHGALLMAGGGLSAYLGWKTLRAPASPRRLAAFAVMLLPVALIVAIWTA